MRILKHSTIPVCILILTLAIFSPVILRGYAAVEDHPLTTPEAPVHEELQLEIVIPDDDANERPRIRFHLVNLGGPFNLVHAVLLPTPTIDDPDHKPVMMSGTGQIIKPENSSESDRIYYMNLHYSQEHADTNPSGYWHDGRIAQISLNLSTLEGSFWMVGTDYNEADGKYDNCFDKFAVALAGPLPMYLQDVNDLLVGQ